MFFTAFYIILYHGMRRDFGAISNIDTGTDRGNAVFTLGRHCADHCVLADYHILSDDTVLYYRAGLDNRTAHNNGILHLRAGFHADACEQNGMFYRTFHMQPSVIMEFSTTAPRQIL